MADDNTGKIANPLADEVPIVAAAAPPAMMTTTTTITTTRSGKEEKSGASTKHPDQCCDWLWMINNLNCNAGCYNAYQKSSQMTSFCDCEDGCSNRLRRRCRKQNANAERARSNRDCCRQEGANMCCYCCECDSIFACGPSVKPKPFATVDRVTVDMPVSAAQISRRAKGAWKVLN